MNFCRCRNNKSHPTGSLLSFFCFTFCTGADVNPDILYTVLRDILFYVYLLMVLPLLVSSHDKLMNWLWWYPPTPAQDEDLLTASLHRLLRRIDHAGRAHHCSV